jgi:hypothetical protein
VDEMNREVPIILFAYRRPRHLERTLASLRRARVPLIHCFSDGPQTAEAEPSVAAVRRILRAVDWCQVVLVERPRNLGLGRSVREGVTSVLEQHDAVIVFEDDLVCAPGTYDYLVAALERYRDEPRVMSVTGWTHPRVTPRDVGGLPYFDGRTECLVWGTWRRAWQGMDRDAVSLMRECARRGIDVRRYGDDLPIMAEREMAQNIWAVRWTYLHILRGGLCLRPPRSLVEDIGHDSLATNAKAAGIWAAAPLTGAASLPRTWPPPIENTGCAALWRAACRRSWKRRVWDAGWDVIRRISQGIGPGSRP